MAITNSPKVWLADLTYTQQTIAADVIPNGIGGIATYTERKVTLNDPVRIFKYPEKLQEALNSGDMPDVIGFSNYVWNSALSHGFAKVIKKKSPETIVIFGGPNYPTSEDEQRAYLQHNADVDFYIIKEGENAFAQLLEAIVEERGDIDAVKKRRLGSVHSIAEDGEVILSPELSRLTDLAEIPSPYTSGRLDEFFDGFLLPIVQTNRGCPFGCTFCVEGVKYYNKIRKQGQDKVREELHYIGKKMQKLQETGGRNDLFIADSNFGMYVEDIETAKDLAETRKLYGWPEYINVATGKNQKERVLEASRIIDGALRLSGSVQSLDPVVLENIKRKNIDAQDLFDLGLKAAEVDANTYSEVILALPGDSLKAHLSTVKTVMNAGFTNIYLFQLMLLPGTEMATNESKKRYGMDTRYRVLPRCYGYFDVLGERVVTAEIEEICVANSTLSFDDYIEARRLHLVVTIFYNDGVFAALLKLLRSLSLPIFRWIEIILSFDLPENLKPLFDSFTDATRNELWGSRGELEKFVQEEGVVKQFISGELGNNLLFIHKTLAITTYFEQLADVARDAMHTYLCEENLDTPDILEFVDDALKFHCLRARNLFEEQDKNPIGCFNYHIDGYLNASGNAKIEEFKLKTPAEFCFVLDESQKTLIERYVGIYGNSSVSIGRILSKVHVKKLFRHAVEGDHGHVLKSEKQGEKEFLISGLQK